MTITRSTRRWNWTLTNLNPIGAVGDRTHDMLRFFHQPGPVESIDFPAGGGPHIRIRRYRPPNGEPGLGDPPNTSPSKAWPTFSPAVELNVSGWGVFLFVQQAVAGTATVFAQITRHRTTPTDPQVEVVTPNAPFGAMTVDLNETGPILLSTIGILQNQAGGKDVQAGDIPILNLTFSFQAKSAGTLKYSISDAFDSLLLSPFHMADPKIIWNGNLLQFPHGLSGYGYMRKTDRSHKFSQGGVSASALRHKFEDVKIQLTNFDDLAFRADLRAWWAWASSGNDYSFSLDGTEDADTTLIVEAPVGSTTLTLATLDGVTAGKRYVVRTADGRDEEHFLIDSFGAGTDVITLTPTRFQYVVGSIFRSIDHFPKVVSVDTDDPVSENLTTFNLIHRMREDRG